MQFLKKVFAHSPGHYIATVILAVAAGAFRFLTLPVGTNARFVWYETLSVSGWVTFLIGALMTVAYLGAFDLFGYLFSPKGSGQQRKERTYADYSNGKAEKRAAGDYYFVPYYVVGVIVILVSLLFG